MNETKKIGRLLNEEEGLEHDADAVESQRMLGAHEDEFPEYEDDDDDEIEASKTSARLRTYKIAGVALIIALISFTVNTVWVYLTLLTAGICTVCPGRFRLAKAVCHAVLCLRDVLTEDTCIIPHGV
jgi:hypothetical protein